MLIKRAKEHEAIKAGILILALKPHRPLVMLKQLELKQRRKSLSKIHTNKTSKRRNRNPKAERLLY